MGKRRRRKRTSSKLLTVHIPPEERLEMVIWLGNSNWSEMVSKMFRDAVQEAKKRKEPDGFPPGPDLPGMA